jgi:hypothetical protein
VSTSTSTRRPGHAGTGRQQERHHGDQPGGDRQVDHCAVGYASLGRTASGKLQKQAIRASLSSVAVQ